MQEDKEPELQELKLHEPELQEPELQESELQEPVLQEPEQGENAGFSNIKKVIDIVLKKAFAYKANLTIFKVIRILCIIGFVVLSTLFISKVIIKPYRTSKSADATKSLSNNSLIAQDAAAISTADSDDVLDGEETIEMSETKRMSETDEMLEASEMTGTDKIADTAGDTTWAEGILAQEEELSANAEGILTQDEELLAITEHAPAAIELTPTPVPKKDNKSRRIPFKELLKQNEDVKGWITIPDSNVDYAVVQSSKNDPEYYLFKGLDKKYSKAGTLFLDIHSSVEENTQNLVIHGHNMVSTKEKMFHMILEYKDINFYKKHPVFTFDTIHQSGEWKVFAVFVTNGTSEKEPLFDFMKSTFASSSEFLNFVYQVRLRSILNIDTVDINEKDQLIMLSTCSNYELGNYRSVIVARKVREGEDTYVD
ncbi:MAG TPA: class B sortase, partial [Mobilitalea sp.]|nr:class B sortase [Mobilitalea sp.]